jgi:hypothetical protein
LKALPFQFLSLKKKSVKPRFVLSFILAILCLNALPQDPDHWELIIDASDNWKYLIPSSEPSGSWTNIGFDDSDWNSGPGGFGYGDNDDNTILPEGTISVFIRKSFEIKEPSDLLKVILYIDYDDGFVAYLNGTEIARSNIGIPGIRPQFNTTAKLIIEPASVSGGNPPRFIIDSQKLSASLKTGTNILAIQVHNSQKMSPDLSSVAYLIGGFLIPSYSYRQPPSWFTPPFTITSHLSLIAINTENREILDEPKIDAVIKVIDNHNGTLNNIDDAGTDFEGMIGIEIRGQSSQMFPKKSYGFETRNPQGADTSVSLLTMPDESDWILHAPYSDKTLMRNPLTYYLGNRMGRWQPRTRWCELYLNGDYRGIYLLVEKIKRDKDRVNIDKLLPEDVKGDSVTGGYIVKVDKLDGLSQAEYFTTNPISYSNARHYSFTYVYPSYNIITTEQKAYLRDYLTRFENALNGTAFKDPVSGYLPFIDENSFIDFEIIQELTNNVDGYRYSTFFYKQNVSEGGKLCAGPLWDFDLCYGNVDYSPRNLATNQWLFTHYGANEGSCMHWWARLMQDPDYLNLLKWRYTSLRNGPLNTDSVFYYLDSQKEFLGDAIDRNFTRWPILNSYVWPNYYIGGTYDNEMDYLKSWTSDRLDWLDSKWLIPAGLSEINTTPSVFSVTPNPFHSRIILKFNCINNEKIHIQIFDLQGHKKLDQYQDQPENPGYGLTVDGLEFPEGVYLIRVEQGLQLIGSQKILKLP